MLCPNCKTELIDVNGRYICSDCGKEVPENEVMTSDWGNSAPAADGLYDAANAMNAPEEGSMPVSTFETSLTEAENETIDAPTVEEVLQEQGDESPISVPLPQAPEIQTVEAVLQNQTDAEQTGVGADSVETQPDIGFYAAPVAGPKEAVPEPIVENIPEVPAYEPVLAPELVMPAPPVTPVVSEPEEVTAVPIVLADPVVPGTEAQSIPVNVVSEPAPVPQQPEVVRDMFESVPAAPISDPGLYANNYEEAPVLAQAPSSAATGAPASNEKRMNMVILIAGFVVALSLIAGGTWAYTALSKTAPILLPVVTGERAVSWQELQVVDAGFKISFPGQPNKTESTETIGGGDSTVVTHSYSTDDVVYRSSYTTLAATADQLPVLLDDLVTIYGLDVLTQKVGTYYDADAIDFTIGRDDAKYQGKMMLKNGKYIVIMAGSDSGQSTDYSKFVKSFNFIIAN